LFVYDQDGELVWKKDLGVLDGGYYVVPEAQWEFGSSPIIHQKRVYVQCDVQGESFVAAYKLKDGEEVWRTVRDEVPTWGTPTVHGKGKKAQLIVNGYKHIGAYNADNGKPVWWLKGGGDIPVPTPVLGHGLVYITNAHGSAAPMYAIDPSAKGDLSFDSQPKKGGAIRWYDGRSGAYMQTPLVYGEFIYSCSDNGTLTTYDAKSGKNLGRQRLGDGSTGFTASAVAANEHLYYTGEEGDVIVLQVGPTPKVVATNSLGEVCMATPAISEGVIYFRGRRHLIAVGK
jgi:hypothetical protein